MRNYLIQYTSYYSTLMEEWALNINLLRKDVVAVWKIKEKPKQVIDSEGRMWNMTTTKPEHWND